MVELQRSGSFGVNLITESAQVMQTYIQPVLVVFQKRVHEIAQRVERISESCSEKSVFGRQRFVNQFFGLEQVNVVVDVEWSCNIRIYRLCFFHRGLNHCRECDDFTCIDYHRLKFTGNCYTFMNQCVVFLSSNLLMHTQNR